MGNEAPSSGGSEAASRSPTLKDLAQICAELNRLGAKYVVIGGFAMIQAGYARTTEDIDLLVETTPENETKVIQALLILPDKAASELKPGEIAEYGVVRVGDEVLVDLMKSGCGVNYQIAIQDAGIFEVEGVPVPFASPKTLWQMKQTHRAKDEPDRLYLRELLKAQGHPIEPPSSLPEGPNPFTSFWKALKRHWRM